MSPTELKYQEDPNNPYDPNKPLRSPYWQEPPREPLNPEQVTELIHTTIREIKPLTIEKKATDPKDTEGYIYTCPPKILEVGDPHYDRYLCRVSINGGVASKMQTLAQEQPALKHILEPHYLKIFRIGTYSQNGKRRMDPENTAGKLLTEEEVRIIADEIKKAVEELEHFIKPE